MCIRWLSRPKCQRRVEVVADNWVVSGAIHRVVLSGKTLFVTAGQPFGETGFHLVTFIHFLLIR